MSMLKAKKIRLDESRAGRRHLGDDERAECRGLYNWWVIKLRAGERWNWQDAKKTLAKTRAYDPAIDQVYGKLLAEIYFRLDEAMRTFFRRLARSQGSRVSARAISSSPCARPSAYLRFEGKRLVSGRYEMVSAKTPSGTEAVMPHLHGETISVPEESRRQDAAFWMRLAGLLLLAGRSTRRINARDQMAAAEAAYTARIQSMSLSLPANRPCTVTSAKVAKPR